MSAYPRPKAREWWIPLVGALLFSVVVLVVGWFDYVAVVVSLPVPLGLMFLSGVAFRGRYEQRGVHRADAGEPRHSPTTELSPPTRHE